jgi:hypothetical protein
MAGLESLLISTCLERENRDGVIKNYLKDGPQKPSYSFNDVTYLIFNGEMIWELMITY